MPPPVENDAAQAQPQDLEIVDVGYYNMGNDHPPLHEHPNLAINNYAAPVALEVPAQAQADPPPPVCTDPHFSAYTYLTSHFCRRRLTYLTIQHGMLQLVLLQASSTNGHPKALSPMCQPMKCFGNLQSSTSASPTHKFP
jgi:hypothetical protein